MFNLDLVADAQARVVALERELVAARAERDQLIAKAIQHGATQYEVAKHINITKQAVGVALRRAASAA